MQAPQTSHHASSSASTERDAGAGAGHGSGIPGRLEIAPRQFALFGFSLLLLVIGSIWFWRLQPLPKDPLERPVAGSLAWWFRPVEIQPELRLPRTPVVYWNDGCAVGLDLWVCGRGGIMHSPDGGRTWVLQTNLVDGGVVTVEGYPRWSPAGASKAGLGLPGEPGLLLAAVDLPAQATMPDTGKLPPNYSNQNPKDPVAGAWEWRRSWARFLTSSIVPVGGYSRVAFANARVGVVLGEQGFLLRTTNGGATWLVLDLRAPNPKDEAEARAGLRLTDLAVVGSNIWVAGPERALLHSPDGGQRWIAQVNFMGLGRQRSTLPFTATAFRSESEGWAWGRSARSEPRLARVSTWLAHTTNGGAEWRVQPSGPPFAGGSEPAVQQNVAQTGSTNAAATLAEPVLLGWRSADQVMASDGSGQLWVSQNGGRRWERAVSFSADRPRALHWASDNQVRVWGSSGALYRSLDGGVTWTPSVPELGGRSVIRMLPRSEVGGASAGNFAGWVGASLNGGVAMVGPTNSEPRALNLNWLGAYDDAGFLDNSVGLAVADGKLLRSVDAGARWMAVELPGGPRVSAMALHRPEHVWVGTEDGRLFSSDNAGRRWRRSAATLQGRVRSLAAVDAARALVIDGSGNLFRVDAEAATRDDAVQTEAWATNPVRRTAVWVNPDGRVTVDGGGQGVVERGADSIWVRERGGATSLWNQVESFVISTNQEARVEGDTLRMNAAGTGLWAGALSGANTLPTLGTNVVSRGGFLALVSRGKAGWTARLVHLEPQGTLHDAVWIGTNLVWAVGEGGTILHSADGGKNWVRQGPRVRTAAPLTRVDFVDANRGWVFGEGRTLLRTEDGGKTWDDPRRAVRYPAPAYWVYLVLVGLFVVRPALRPPPPIAAEASIANMGVADRPLRTGERDELSLGDLAKGLSEYLRNRATTAPMTLAITGGWGSGKSSLMNLLSEDLSRRGFRPVWFNAWHHPSEEHLLAALLESIRGQALPPIWLPVEFEVPGAALRRWLRRETFSVPLPSGLEFRVRLIALRCRSQWLPVLSWTLLLSAGVGLLARLGVGGERTLAGLAVFAGGDLVGTLVSFVKGIAVGQAAGAGAIVIAALRLWASFRAFGVDPSRFLTTLEGKAAGGDPAAQTSLRFRFAREFGEVTRALAPRHMVIFIDDLDRCEPPQVMEILRAVSFLATSGECYLVLGMEERVTQAAVAHQLGARFENEAGEDQPASAQASQRWDYAGNWMEKLIQVRIRIPKADEAQFRRMLVGSSATPRREESSVSTVRAVLRAVSDGFGEVRQWWPGLLLASLVGLGLWAGYCFDPATLGSGGTDEAEAAKNRVSAPTWYLSGQWGGTNLALRVSQAPPSEGESKPAASASPTDSTSAPAGDLLERSGEVQRPSSAPSVGSAIVSEIPGEFRPGRTASTPWGRPAGLILVLALFGLWRLLEARRVETRDSEDFAKALERWNDFIWRSHPTPRSVKRFINRVRFYAMLARPALLSQTRRGRLESSLVVLGALQADRRTAPLLADLTKLEEILALVPSHLAQDVRDLHALRCDPVVARIFARLESDARIG